jgi:hypothetical protein
MKKYSKGMRKHIRAQKSAKRKHELPVFSTLPDYDSFPLTLGIKGWLSRATCPKCKCGSSGPEKV